MAQTKNRIIEYVLASETTSAASRHDCKYHKNVALFDYDLCLVIRLYFKLIFSITAYMIDLLRW